MIKLENTKVSGFESAIRGMRNPMNSWDRSDSAYCDDRCYCDTCPWYEPDSGCSIPWSPGECIVVGPNDLDLMKRLAAGGPVHAKYRRMIVVYVDITAPLYWWKEFDTYKVGTVANSCSTMHKIHAKEFSMDDFSHDHLELSGQSFLMDLIRFLNDSRMAYLDTKDKAYWWQLIQLLPSSYNQKRTVMLNYEVLHNIYNSRKDHKLDEWHYFCEWIRELPYADEVIL